MSMEDFEIEVVETTEAQGDLRDFAEGFLAGISIVITIAT